MAKSIQDNQQYQEFTKQDQNAKTHSWDVYYATQNLRYLALQVITVSIKLRFLQMSLGKITVGKMVFDQKSRKL
jgi:hypothetical protein